MGQVHAIEKQGHRPEWTLELVKEIYNQPFMDLLTQAHAVHCENFDPNEVQISTLLNFKTGGCPENCSYCPQSAHYDTGVEKEPMMPLDEVKAMIRKAKDAGASRFCMAAGWRGPRDEDIATLQSYVKAIKDEGMEACMSLGLLKNGQAEALKEAGVDYYNHNLDSSEDFYEEIITTRTYQDRLDTLDKVQEAGMHICSGGILGMGETIDQRLKLLMTLSELPNPPKSVTVNKLIPVPGTPLEDKNEVDPFDFVRTIATARIMFPSSRVRLSAGRKELGGETQAMSFYAGANSIHYGEKLLTTDNAAPAEDRALLDRLGMRGV